MVTKEDSNGSPATSNHHHNFHHVNYHSHQHHQTSVSSAHSTYSQPHRIAELQEEYLIPMKEDLSDWLKAILDIDDLDANNFMSRLDNGVIVCKLAKLIEERCDIDDPVLINGDCKKFFLAANQYNINNTTNNNNNNTDNNSLKNNLINNDLSNSKQQSVNGDQGQYRSGSNLSNGRRSSFNYGHPNGNLMNGSNYSGICARTMKCWENAKSETFYARDNVSNFIKWCRKLNVRECVLFESEDLVLHNNPKNVVLCLLEVARIACKKFMFTPAPGLVQFEQEIDAEEKAELEREMARRRKRRQAKLLATSINKNNNKNSSNISNHSDAKSVGVNTNDDDSSNNNNKNNVNVKNDLNANELIINNNNNNNNDDDEGCIDKYIDENDEDDDDDENTIADDETKKDSYRPDSVDLTGGLSSDNTSINAGDDGVDGWSSVSQENLGRASSVTSISSTSVESNETSSQAAFGQETAKVVSQLDQKVMLIAKSYYGKKAKHGIQRLAEGKYRIAGKIVFVRLLKDRHVMVRVGGGWDTLQHFLERHGNGSDPVKEISPSDLLPMDTRPSESMSRRRNSQSSQQNVPSTPVLRRCLSSTPVSRSSLSSPEPWTNCGVAGGSPSCYSAGLINGHRSLARRSSACTTISTATNASNASSTISSSSSSVSTSDKSALPISTSTHSTPPSVTRRRSLVNESSRSTIKPNRSMLSLNLTRSPSTSSYLNSSFSPRYFNASNSNLNTSSNSNNSNQSTPTGTKTSRYPNYLQSSQHITRRSSPGSSSSSASPSSNSHNSKSPATPTTSPQSTPLRRASLKAF